MPVSKVDPLAYGRVAPPVLTLETSLPVAAGAHGYHVEVRYEGRTIFTTDWSRAVAKGATTPLYRSEFGTYTKGMRSLAIAR